MNPCNKTWTSVLAGICLLAVCGTEKLVAGLTERREVFRMEITEDLVKNWRNNKPDLLKISYLPNGGEDGKPAISFRVMKPINGKISTTGPVFQVPACSENVIKRSLPMVLHAKMPGFFTGMVGLNMLNSSTGQRFLGIAGNRDFNTALYIGRTQYPKWSEITRHAGCRLNDNGAKGVRLMFDFSVADGKGEFVVDSLVVYEECETDHKFISDALGHVFFGETGTLKVQWVEPEKLKNAEVSVYDEEKNLLWKKAVVLPLQESEITFPERGFYEIHADAEYQDGRKMNSVSTAAVVGPVLPEAVRSQSRFGLMRCHMSPDFAMKLGSNWDSNQFKIDAIRLDSKGKMVSTLNPNSARTPDQPRIKNANALSDLPHWLKNPKCKGHELRPPKDWNKLAQAVELWTKTNPNLPDVVCPFHEVDAVWRGTEAELVKFHNIVTDAFHRGKPGIVVSGPMFCSINMTWFRRRVNAGIMKNMDAVNIHPYVQGTPPEEKFIHDIVEMQEFLEEKGFGKIPVYFTEFGWSSWDKDWQPPVDSLTRARYCARSLILCTVRDIAGLVYFAGRYNEPVDIEHYWIVKSNYTPYSILSAYTTAAKELATVHGGEYLHLAPDVFACIFKRGDKALMTVWTMNGTQEYSFPESPLSIRGMTGKKLEAKQTVTLSPSPIYVEFSTDAFTKNKRLPKVEILPGNPVPVEGDVIPSPFYREIGKGSVGFPDNASLGEYTILTRKDGVLQLTPVELITPVVTAYKNYSWNGTDPDVRISITAKSRLAQPCTGKAELVVNGKILSSVPFTLAPNQDTEVTLPYPATSGIRVKGQVVLNVESPLKRRDATAFDITPTRVPYDPQATGEPDWSKVPAINISAWQDQGDVKPILMAPVKSSLKLAANKDGLNLQVLVNDPEHVQREGAAGSMWNEDSLQLGFDFDADKEWEPNNIYVGFNGHRVVEYGVSLTEKNNIQTWCFKGYVDGVKEGRAPRLVPHTRIVRDEAQKTTLYTLHLPWAELGSETPPQTGKLMGFSLLVNDKNSKGHRTVQKFGKGLMKSDPFVYGRIVLASPK